jgi:hypothetical protein
MIDDVVMRRRPVRNRPIVSLQLIAPPLAECKRFDAARFEDAHSSSQLIHKIGSALFQLASRHSPPQWVSTICREAWECPTHRDARQFDEGYGSPMNEQPQLQVQPRRREPWLSLHLRRARTEARAA